MHPEAPARIIRLGDPLRRPFLDELRRRVSLPRPLAAEWALAQAELSVGIVDDGHPTFVVAAGDIDGACRWTLRQPLDDFEQGELVSLRAREFAAHGRAGADSLHLAGLDIVALVAAVADALDRVAELRPEQASAPRSLALALRQATDWIDEEDRPVVADDPEDDEDEPDEEDEDEPAPAPRPVPAPPPAPTVSSPTPPARRRRRRSAVLRTLVVLLILCGTTVGVVVLAGPGGTPEPSEPAAAEATVPTAAQGVAPSDPAPDYVVQLRNPDGSPVRFDPCRPYDYVVQPGSIAPHQASLEVGAAFAALEEATGIPFRFAGSSPARFPHPLDPANLPRLPILVSFERPADSPALRETSDQLEDHASRPLGGLAVGTPVQARPGLTVIGGGAVVIDEGLETRQRVRILLHELGHLVGLGHAGDPGQMMAAAIPEDGPAAYREGDRAGLAEVGAPKGCVLTDAERTALFG